tara:strand:+ start:201 stop:398 length:198 start_codon:yes stop_codon:yes gene_type:complete
MLTTSSLDSLVYFTTISAPSEGLWGNFEGLKIEISINCKNSEFEMAGPLGKKCFFAFFRAKYNRR